MIEHHDSMKRDDIARGGNMKSRGNVWCVETDVLYRLFASAGVVCRVSGTLGSEGMVVALMLLSLPLENVGGENC